MIVLKNEGTGKRRYLKMTPLKCCHWKNKKLLLCKQNFVTSLYNRGGLEEVLHSESILQTPKLYLTLTLKLYCLKPENVTRYWQYFSAVVFQYCHFLVP